MAARVVAYGCAQLVRKAVEVGEQLLDREVLPPRTAQRGVEVRHVRSVMLAVVDAHRQLVDGGLQHGVRIGSCGSACGTQRVSRGGGALASVSGTSLGPQSHLAACVGQ